MILCRRDKTFPLYKEIVNLIYHFDKNSYQKIDIYNK